ncbi:MAG: hypothetical protein ACRDWV_03085 [Acidimicrobiales bacterium]
MPINLPRRSVATRVLPRPARPFGALPGDPGAPPSPTVSVSRPGYQSLLGQMFPQPEPGPRTARGRILCVGALLGVLALGTVLTILRQQGVAATNSVWAEDASKFLTQAAVLGPWHAIWQPVGGFLNLWPRLLAALTVEVSAPAAAAVWIAVTAALTSTACGLIVYVASAGHVRSRSLRALLALTVILPTVGNGQIANDWNNLHWYFVIVALWVLLWRPRSTGVRILAGVVAGIGTATDPTCLLLAPLVVARLVVVKDWREQAQVGGWAVGGLAQLAVVIAGITGVHKLFLPSFAALVSSWPIRVGLGSLVGPVLTNDLFQGIGWVGAAVATVVLAAVAGAALAAPGRHRLLISGLLLASFFWYMATYLVRLEAAFIPGSADLAVGVRYAAVPTWFVVSALVLVLDRLVAGWGRASPQLTGATGWGRASPQLTGASPAAARPALAVATAVVVGLVLASVATSFPASRNARQNGPAWAPALLSASVTCAAGVGVVGTDPPAVPVATAPLIRPTPMWYAFVPCRDGKLAWR